MKIRFAALTIALSAIAAAAQANTIQYTLSGDPSDFWVYKRNQGAYAYTFTDYQLSAANAGGIDPAFTTSAGDVVSGTITMSDSVTMPASLKWATVGIDLQIVDDQDASIVYSETVAFYDKGQAVTVPALLGYSGASGGELSLGIGTVNIEPTPAFTFDTIVFSAEITGIYDSQNNPEASMLLDAVAPDMYFQSWAPLSSVPEPASAWLALGGWGLACAFMRRQRR